MRNSSCFSSNFAFKIIPARIPACLVRPIRQQRTLLIRSQARRCAGTSRVASSNYREEGRRQEERKKKLYRRCKLPCQESDYEYDDVGPPTNCREYLAEDCEEIYDDVLPPADRQQDSSTSIGRGYLLPETREMTISGREPIVKGPRGKDRATADDDQYFSNNNEYSSVDCESYLEEPDDLGVYDDVGLPHGEERVNSLYAGSVLGLTSMNGKESEWEDLEEVSSASRCPCQINNTW